MLSVLIVKRNWTEWYNGFYLYSVSYLWFVQLWFERYFTEMYWLWFVCLWIVRYICVLSSFGLCIFEFCPFMNCTMFLWTVLFVFIHLCIVWCFCELYNIFVFVRSWIVRCSCKMSCPAFYTFVHCMTFLLIVRCIYERILNTILLQVEVATVCMGNGAGYTTPPLKA